MFPSARKQNLKVSVFPTETVVHDLATARIHCLNRTTSFVWRACDGRTSVAEMAERLGREVGLPQDEAVVELALEQLQRRNLLDNAAFDDSAERRAARRQVLRKLVKVGMIGAAIPLIASLTARPAHALQSSKVTLGSKSKNPPARA